MIKRVEKQGREGKRGEGTRKEDIGTVDKTSEAPYYGPVTWTKRRKGPRGSF